jgi:membrane protease YdiL (CAAX protease family)
VKNIYNQLNPGSKLGIVALVTLFSLLVSMIVAAVISIPIFGIDNFTKMVSSSVDMGDENISFLKFLQLVQSIGLFIVPSIILALFFGESITGYLKLNKQPYQTSIVLAIIIVIVASPFINFIGEINSKLTLPSAFSSIEQWMRASEDAAEKLTKLFLKTETTWGLVFNIFLIGIIPAVGEELLFRGVVQRIFSEWTKNVHWGIWISAILFSALHFQFYGFVPRAILGAIFGYLFVWSGNLWLPVLAHFINNTVAVIAYHLYGEGILAVDPDKIGTDSDYHVATIGSIILMLCLFWVFYNYEKKKRSEVYG